MASDNSFILFSALRKVERLHGVVVSMLGYKSSGLGSNPGQLYAGHDVHLTNWPINGYFLMGTSKGTHLSGNLDVTGFLSTTDSRANMTASMPCTATAYASYLLVPQPMHQVSLCST